MDTTDLAVSCRDVRKHFGEGETRIEALRGVEFSARFGELSFLVGPSGCGKTTLISVIAGLLDRTAGELAVLGARLEDLSGSGRVLFRRQNVGFVFQQRVALARALVHEPRLVVCDEPTAALDSANGEGVMQLLAGTAVHPDRAVIVVTHDTRVFHHAHSIAHMDDGRIVDVSRPNGSPGPVKSGSIPKEAFA